jgi:hypothetical protein
MGVPVVMPMSMGGTSRRTGVDLLRQLLAASSVSRGLYSFSAVVMNVLADPMSKRSDAYVDQLAGLTAGGQPTSVDHQLHSRARIGVNSQR